MCSHERQRLTSVASPVKNNFVGVENPRLYSETYYGTKHLAQNFIDELGRSLAYLLHSSQLTQSEKYSFAQHLNANLGRTAFCLSGGASFAWYHFGVVKALLDAKLLPDIVTGSMFSPRLQIHAEIFHTFAALSCALCLLILGIKLACKESHHVHRFSTLLHAQS